MKKVMPFVQATREKMAVIGVQALSLTMEFDEPEILKQNALYLASTLDVSRRSCLMLMLFSCIRFSYQCVL